MKQEQLFRIFFLAVFLFIIFQILRILSPFYTGILGAIVLTLIFYPLHQLVLKKVSGQRPNLAATLSSLLVLLLIIFPFVSLSWMFFNELPRIYQVVEKFGNAIEKWRSTDGTVQMQWVRGIETKLQVLLNLDQINFQEILKGVTAGVIKRATMVGKELPKYAFVFVVNMLIMILTLFFLFREGHSIFKKGKGLIPMDDRYKDHISDQLYLTITAVVRGVFLIAVVQGVLAGIGFVIGKVPSPVILGFITIFVALIPFVGATVIWLPISLYYLLQGSLGKGVFLLVWGIFVVSLVDNFLRPILIGSRAKLPIFFLFFGILGGIKVYGPMGLFLGPLVVALVIAFIKIYQEEYQPGKEDESSTHE